MVKKKEKKVLSSKRVSVIHTVAVREGSLLYGNRSIRNAKEAAEWMLPFVKDADKEYVIVCCMEGHNQPVSIEKVAVGILNQCLVGMREVFKNAILSNAAAIILYHNHPSGVVEPSQSDVAVSKRLKEAGALLDIEILDHIILGDNAFYSMSEHLNWGGWNETECVMA